MSSLGQPSSAPPSWPGCQWTTSSIFLASAKSLSVMPLAAWFFSLHLDPGVRGGDVGMVPGGLGEMADGVDHHQRALPAIGLVFAPDPAVLEIPMGQLLLEPLLDLAIAIGALGRCHRRLSFERVSRLPFSQSITRGFGPINGSLSRSVTKRKQGSGSFAPGARNHNRAAPFWLSRSKRAGHAAVRLVRAFARSAQDAAQS